MNPINYEQLNELIAREEGGRLGSRFLARNYAYNHDVMVAYTGMLIEAGCIAAEWDGDQYVYETFSMALLVMANCYRCQQRGLKHALAQFADNDDQEMLAAFGFHIVKNDDGETIVSNQEIHDESSKGTVH